MACVDAIDRGSAATSVKPFINWSAW
jgi:hypothetical protein